MYRLLGCFCTAFLLSVAGPTARCGPVSPCVVLLVPGIRASDLSRPELPSLTKLISEGGSGWMLCRAARVADSRLLRPDGRESEASLLATLGSGSRAVAPLLPPDSPTARFAVLRAANAHLDHPVTPGALGDLFHRLRLKTATLGDRDSAWPDENAWTVAMDAAGRVDLPMTRPALLSDAKAPFGVRTDVEGLLASFDAVRDTAGLIVVDCEDLDRADRYALLCRPAIAANHRAAACRTLDALLFGLMRRCRAQNGSSAIPILLLSPAPAASSEERNDRLAPIVWWGSGDAAGTLLTASTRRPGLVLNTDMLATFADRLHLSLPSGATGRPFHSSSLPVSPTASRLAAQYEEWMRVSRLQNAPGGLPTVQLLLPLIGTGLLLWSARVNAETRRRLHRVIGALALQAVTLPLGMLLLPLLSPPNTVSAAALLAVPMLTVGLFTALRPHAALSLFRLLCGTLLLILLLDLPTGTHLLQSAWMSYSVVEGARFYGIGNEYMGVAIGAACVLFATGGERQETKKPLPGLTQTLGFAVLFLIVTLAMGIYGAKVGAIPSAGAAFGVTLLVWKRGRLGGVEIASVLLLTALGLALLAVFDARHAAGDQTHFIRALTGAGGGSLPEIFRRKLQMEGRLLLHSAWSATLLLTGAALLWTRRTSPERFASRRRQAALTGIGAGAAACLLCNDSGLTAAALLLLIAWAWAILETVRPVPPSSAGEAASDSPVTP